MGLTQYKEAVIREHINGDVLSDCDEEMLQHDLGITSKLHIRVSITTEDALAMKTELKHSVEQITSNEGVRN